MSGLPLVSIVTPSFNQAPFLEATIRSVLEQDYPNIEYIVIDGGSTDGSVDIIKRYASRLSYWVSERDEGQADAINKGWNRAKGELLGWLNSDDELPPASVRAVVQGFDTDRVGLVYGDIEHIDAAGRKTGARQYEDFDLVAFVERVAAVAQPGSLIRRPVLDRIGMLDASLHYMMDHDLWLRAALIADVKHVPEVVARFRIHGDAKSTQRLDVAARDVHVIYDKLFSNTELPAELRAIEKRARASSHVFSAEAFFGADDMQSALYELFRAAQGNPAYACDPAYLKLLARVLVTSAIGGRHSPLANFARGRLRKRAAAVR